jgi:hypothetical protein
MKHIYRTSELTSDIHKLLNNAYVGKSFVYRTKYGGETIGEIESVNVGLEYVYDTETNKSIQAAIDMSKYGRKSEQSSISKRHDIEYCASRPTVWIKSTNDISYPLKDIFIVDHFGTIQLLNSERCLLKALKITLDTFEIQDMYRDSIAVLSKDEMDKFVHGMSTITNPKTGQVYDYSKYSDSMKPNISELYKFIGLDITTNKTE